MHPQRTSLAVSAAALSLSVSAFAAVPGYVERFNNGIADWAGGSTLSNPLGGRNGAADGYLLVSQAVQGNLGCYTTSPEFTGDLTAVPAELERIYFWVSNAGDNEPIEVHAGIGTAPTNVWLYRFGVIPIGTDWTSAYVDLTDESQWIQIQGSGTFEEAKAACDRLFFRHDVEPFGAQPDPIAGDFGIDEVHAYKERCLQGDLDYDDEVDLDDLLILLGLFDSDCGGYYCDDVDGDGEFDLDDLVLLLGMFGDVC